MESRRVENLFPRFGEMPSYRAQREYVQERLVEMAQAKALCLTDCMAQRPPIPDLVCEVILGHDYGPDRTQRQGIYVPHELQAATVRLVSIPCKVQVDEEQDDGTVRSKYVTKRLPISFACGARTTGTSGTLEAARAVERPWAELEWQQEVWHHTGEHDVRLPVAQAIWALKQYGQDVKNARGKVRQLNRWRLREVRLGEEIAPTVERKPSRVEHAAARP